MGEHPGYFCGFSANIGDSLLFQVYNDQTHRVVDVSVLRPYTSNKRVQWDTSIQNNECDIHAPPFTPPKCFTRANINNIDREHMDQYDHDKPNLNNFATEPTPERVSKYQSQIDLPDVDLTPPTHAQILQLLPVSNDPYKGPFKLSLSFVSLKIDPTIHQLP